MIDKLLKINHDKNIKLNTKVIYSELLAMVHKFGMIFVEADNQDIANNIGISKYTVRDCIKELNDAGYIKIDRYKKNWLFFRLEQRSKNF